MEIRSVAHKGLRRLIEDDDPRGVDAQSARKLRLMIAFLQEATGLEELSAFPNWRPHQLTGERRGVWSLTVTRNWRLTFRIGEDGAIEGLDFEDYH